ncbi:xanthine dehydrogenase family protein molybdopterin-binding subunit [Candidatus Halobonum tyrrellensis]|uniref:Aldehyde oxidase and xanthine dehydrogenase molybdopterin binding protein n=1 Tax=Candidatus Halobonum tyrrellensis G22 TaxID=1324957 RepID=V4HGL2_9EURY|nr:xanthine dehydrogenase family protein molybdopterin-binding subunit [Candidatus Halobonum tyrrellensis]ESP86944.1 aldehyde oxidase and xanthine dehydrogenase molybdopterin binding protein [Candidatus Halobonum tyrrellensis G22]
MSLTDAPDEQREADEAAGETDDEGGKLVGQGIDRREDAALLTGRATFTDDADAPRVAHLAFVRSEEAHADVEAVDTAAAEALDGVLAAYTWADVEASDAPGVLPISAEALDCDPPGHPVLARERVRYHGQPVAAVVAEDRYTARDGVEAVEVSYDPRPAVVDPVEARGADAPTLFEGAPDNVAVTTDLGDEAATDAAFAAADRTVEVKLENNRLIASALEPRAALAEYDAGSDELTVTMTSQSPHGHRRKLSETLGLPERSIRVVAPSVGGGFGHKGHHHPGEAAAAWAARRLGRPVKWTATRSGNYLAGAHGRDHRTTAKIAVDDDGTIRGLRADTDAGVGGYGLGGGASLPGWYGSLLSSEYAVDAVHCRTRSVFTTTAPVHSYRGAGRPEAIYVTERLVDAAAREVGMDPAELRRRNLIDPDAFPYETPTGATYDSGDYEPALDVALEAVDYEAVKAAPDRDDDGRYRGVGLACMVESTGSGFETGLVRAHPDGTVTVYAGTHSHGQGHGTTYAQIVADELGVPYDDIEVAEGDTERVPTGTGTFGSRSTVVGGNAVAESAADVREKATRIAAHRLDADPADVTLADGTFSAPDGSAVGFADVAAAAHGGDRPAGMPPGLEATTAYESEATAYSFGTHAVEVRVDADTGEVDVETYVAVDDCGERVNPTILDGQVHGGVAQGVGQARSEHAVYGDDGELLTGSMDRYALPRAASVPHVETRATVTPSPHNDLGVKGIGEAGTIAAPPAVVNAVLDALEPLGVDSVDMPLTDERVWRAIHGEPGR